MARSYEYGASKSVPIKGEMTMHSKFEELKQRLRQQPKFYGLGDCCKAAADAIESLEAERDTAQLNFTNEVAISERAIKRAEAAEKELAQWRERWAMAPSGEPIDGKRVRILMEE
jgi:ribonuclease D